MLTLVDAYDEGITEVSNFIIDASFVISTALAPALCFMILRHSKGMGKYRWYLLNSAIFCYAYDFFLTMWKPVWLGASLAGFSNTFLPLNRVRLWVLSTATIICVLHAGLGVVMEIVYRFAQASPTKVREFIERKIYVVYIVVHLLCYGCFVVPTQGFQIWEDVEIDAYAAEYLPPGINLTALNGYWTFRRTTISTSYCLSMALWYASFMVLGIAALVFLWVSTKSKRIGAASKATGRMQAMLLRALIVQVAVAVVFIILPMSTIGMALYLAVPRCGPIVTLMIAVTSLHASIDFMSLFYFVTPYRRAFVRGVRSLKSSKSWIPNGVVSVTHS